MALYVGGTAIGATATEINNALDGMAQGDIVYASSADTPAQLTKGTDDYVLTMNGNVPNWEAAGGANFDTAITINDSQGDNDFRVEGDNEEYLLFCDASTDLVGIGTAAPAGNLHIYNASSGATANASINQLVIENDDSVGISILSPNTSAGYIAFADPQDDIAGGILYDHDANDFKILGKGDTSVMMTIDSAGNVGIGTDNPSTTLDINSASHNVTQFALSVDGGQLLEMGTEGSSSYSWIKAAHSSYSLSLGGGDSVGHLVIDSSGVISGDFNDTSDVALKENIQTISSGLSIVNTLNPITFDWKDESKGSNSGFIAQEVEEVLPNDVSGEDFDISVEDSSIGKSINVTGIVAHLTKAVQELSAKVEALENA